MHVPLVFSSPVSFHLCILTIYLFAIWVNWLVVLTNLGRFCTFVMYQLELTWFLSFRTSSEWQLAGSEGPHAWSRRRVLCRRFQRWNRSCRICAQRRHDLCCSKAGQHQIPFTWGMCTDLIVMDNVFFAVLRWVFQEKMHVWSTPGPLCHLWSFHHRKECCLFNVKFSCVRQGETAYIRVKLDGPRSPSYGRSRSRSRGSRSRSRSRSASRSRSNSRGRGRGSPRYSPRHSRSRSRS